MGLKAVVIFNKEAMPITDDDVDENEINPIAINTNDSRMQDKKRAQQWAGLEISEEKTLLVFVGRWSRQKGIDLIADLTPLILKQYPNTQLICVGPVIDLHGKLAALKLQAIAEQFPTRVFCKPEFTQIPSFVFKGCDFVLLPSRDEPFG